MTKTLPPLDVPEELLDEVMRRAETTEPAAAVLEALRDYARPRCQRDLIKLLGTFDDFMTLDELMAMRRRD